MIRYARTSAGLSQRTLAARAGTSQATLSAYEHGRSVPSAATLERVLAAAGRRLTLTEPQRPVHAPTRAQMAERGRALEEVMELAEALPVRHETELRFPSLSTATD